MVDARFLNAILGIQLSIWGELRMAQQSDTGQDQPKYTEKAYYKARMGEVIRVMFRDNTGYQGRLVGIDKQHIFVESTATEGDIFMINKDAIQLVSPPQYGG
jgi:small nuclear ribonucleoprotein (snRNP)-like protein